MWEKIEVINVTSPRKTGSKDDIQNGQWWAFNRGMQWLMMRKNGVNVVPSKMEYNQRKLYKITKVEYWRKCKILLEVQRSQHSSRMASSAIASYWC